MSYRWLPTEGGCHSRAFQGKIRISRELDLLGGKTMPTAQIRIVDLGRGPQIEGQRLTVMDIFYYLHRGYDWNFIHEAMPTLTREQFDAVQHYVNEHHEELVERDCRIDEFHKRGIEAQHSRGGIFGQSEENLSAEERAAKLKKKMKQHLAEKNGARHPD
jgi:uncharacterized protein (DUF433 family)